MGLQEYPFSGQIVPRPDAGQSAFQNTRNHNMIFLSVLQRTISWFVFVTTVVAVCVPVYSSHAHSMVFVDREWYAWLNWFSYIPNARKEATNGMAK